MCGGSFYIEDLLASPAISWLPPSGAVSGLFRGSSWVWCGQMAAGRPPRLVEATARLTDSKQDSWCWLTINTGISSKQLARQCLCLSIFFRRLSLPNRQIVWQCLLSCLAVSRCAVAAVRWRRHFLWESRHLGLGRKPEAGIGSCRLQSIEDSGLTELWIHP